MDLTPEIPDVGGAPSPRPLAWSQDYDDRNNPIYEAAGLFTDGDGSPEFSYRIKPILEDGEIRWSHEGTDQELIPQERQLQTFATLAEAMDECQRTDDEHRREAHTAGLMKPVEE